MESIPEDQVLIEEIMPGLIIDNKYEVIGMISKGSFGQVFYGKYFHNILKLFVAINKNSLQKVAIKFEK